MNTCCSMLKWNMIENMLQHVKEEHEDMLQHVKVEHENMLQHVKVEHD